MQYDALKRGIDLFFALILLPFLLFILVIIAPAIYLTDFGTIFYNARRLGRYGQPFKMYKFRTMIMNAPDIRLPDGSTYNSDNDPRLTKVGKFLRKTSLDEIPQLLNVLKGDMSFIGPRPDPLDWLDKYSEDEKFFLMVRPGITGYNQAYYRNCADGKTKIVNDNYYAKNISFLFDIKILIKTIKTVLMRENINVSSKRLEN